MSERRRGFADFIEALTILDKYAIAERHVGTHCEHDVLMICGVEPGAVSEADKARLKELGFFVGSEFGDDGFQSYRWGSC